MKRFTLLLISLYILISCSTVPVPESESDSLAVLVTELHKETALDLFGSYIFTITSSDGSYSKNLYILRDKNILLDDLKPGNYSVTYQFKYTGGDWGTKGEAFSFQVIEGKAIIISKKINVRIYRKNNRTTSMTRDFELVTNKEDIKNNLVNKYPELNAWEWDLQ